MDRHQIKVILELENFEFDTHKKYVECKTNRSHSSFIKKKKSKSFLNFNKKEEFILELENFEFFHKKIKKRKL